MEKSELPIFCPACGEPVMVTLDISRRTAAPVPWRCPYFVCGAIHDSLLGAEVLRIERRVMPRPQRPGRAS